MKILKFNEMTVANKLTFENVKPTDLAWMTREQVIEMIFNTFESKIISDDIRWTIIESNWRLIGKSDKINMLRYDDSIVNDEHKVYFIVTMPENNYDQFIVIRGNTNDEVKDFVDYAKSKNPKIEDDKGGNYTNGNHFSTILRREGICRINFSLRPVPKFEEYVDEGGDTYFIHGMGCSVDPTISEKNIDYYSDLLVGTELDMKIK